MDYEVIIVGAGPAGLSAALILGRCRRRVLVLDHDKPRNAVSQGVHGFLTRDGILPGELRALGRAELERYDSVTFEHDEVTETSCAPDGFTVTTAQGRQLTCRKLLLATGVLDDLPPIDGLTALWGQSVLHCPYCDGWERAGQPMVAYSRSAKGVGLALSLKAWSDDIVLCTDGARVSSAQARQLQEQGIRWERKRVARLEGQDGQLERVVFADGSSVERRVMFFQSSQRQAARLAEQLGCAFTAKGAVQTGAYELTNIPGVYVAGDASRLVQLAIVAAAEGAQAAFSINTALTKESLGGNTDDAAPQKPSEQRVDGVSSLAVPQHAQK